MRKIVINKCFGGFGLSREAVARFKELGRDIDVHGYVDEREQIERDDPILVKVVEEMGDAASGGPAKLKVVEIPNSVEWQIEEYDGQEHVAEVHRTWS